MTQRTWNIVTAAFLVLVVLFLAFCFVVLGGVGRAFQDQYEDETMGRAPSVEARP